LDMPETNPVCGLCRAGPRYAAAAFAGYARRLGPACREATLGRLDRAANRHGDGRG